MNNAKKQRKTIEWEGLEISFRKLRYQGNISRKDRNRKDRNGQDLPEAEQIKKKWLEHTDEQKKKKTLNNLNYNDDVVTHLEPDILECEVKWAQETFI